MPAGGSCFSFRHFTNPVYLCYQNHDPKPSIWSIALSNRIEAIECCRLDLYLPRRVVLLLLYLVPFTSVFCVCVFLGLDQNRKLNGKDRLTEKKLLKFPGVSFHWFHSLFCAACLCVCTWVLNLAPFSSSSGSGILPGWSDLNKEDLVGCCRDFFFSLWNLFE